MKKLLLSLTVLVATTCSYSQGSLPNGSSQFNVGLGLSGWGVPIYAGFDFGVSKDITLGGEFSYRSYKENWKNNNYNHNIIGISGNGNYHFNRVLNIAPAYDFYAGLNIGFYSWSSPDGYTGDHTSGLGLGAQVGGRYYFGKKAGINLEFGGGNAFTGGKFGLTFKL